MAETKLAPSAAIMTTSARRDRDAGSGKTSSTPKESAERTEKKARNSLLDEIAAHAKFVSDLADSYSKNPTEELRRQINKESLHLHGEVTVMSRYMDHKSKGMMFEMEDAVNQSIEQAAKSNKREVEYLNINSIMTPESKGVKEKTASAHLFEKLVNAESPEQYLSSINKKVMEKLGQYHTDSHGDAGEAEQLLRRLFDMKSLSRTDEETGRKGAATIVDDAIDA